MRRRSRAGGEPAKTRRRKTVTLKCHNATKSARGRSSSVAGQKPEVAQLIRDLDEAHQQQTATAEVLKIISYPTFDLRRVLDTLVESAVKLCDGYDAVILLREKESLVFGAHYGPVPLDFKKWPLTRNWTAGRAVIDAKPVHVHDLTTEGEEFPEGAAMALRMGHPTILSVPLLREDEAIGSLTLRRAVVRPFTEKQIELVTTFADQAVIAIENVRLFEAEQQRSRELSESLEQQTATAEVLSVISNSPGDLEPVFAAMLENAVRICDAKWGTIHRWDSGALHLMATHNLPPAFAEARGRSSHYHAHPKSLFGRLVATKMPVHTADSAAEQVYTEKLDPTYVAAVELGGVHGRFWASPC